ncbi:MAG TPA: MFS transporter [Trueperaceae bacterium]|nr:MFS transporter [Trueperaceae bacterium]
MRLSMVEGGLVQVLLNWTSGAVLVGYLLTLGATSTHIALVGSVPFLAQVASPFGAWAAEVLGRRRALAATLAAVGRASWVLAALLPELAVPDALRPTLLVMLVFIASAFQSATATVWTAWMGDVVPEARRGRYFGTRTGVLGVIGMVANLGAGAFLDRVAAPLSFQVVIGVAVVSSFVAILLLLLHFDPPTVPRRLQLREVFKEPIADKNFRRFLGFSIYWQFTVMLGAPFVMPYFLERLSMSFTQVALWTSIAATTALATTILWGRVADRVGNKGVLAIGTFLAGALLPSNWILAGLTGNLGFIWVSAAFDAIAWGAIGPAIFNLALVSAPRSGRVIFIAQYSLVSGVAGFVGGVLSGPLLLFLSGLDYRWLPAGWSGYHSLFAISGIGRMLAWAWLRRVKEANAWRTRDLLRSVRSAWRSLGLMWR